MDAREEQVERSNQYGAKTLELQLVRWPPLLESHDVGHCLTAAGAVLKKKWNSDDNTNLPSIS